MSLIPRNRTRDFWWTKDFLGSTIFIHVMGRQRLTTIRSALKIYSEHDHSIATSGPLWHSRIIMEHFMKNCTDVAVPTGLVSLGKNIAR